MLLAIIVLTLDNIINDDIYIYLSWEAIDYGFSGFQASIHLFFTWFLYLQCAASSDKLPLFTRLILSGSWGCRATDCVAE